jgi:2-C-methyl-D-erythritol 4-phosphate cytidylyltransferase
MPRHLALIPAAGSGSRMGFDMPKQYAALAGKPMIWHALRLFAENASIDKIYVALASDDRHWDRHGWSEFAQKLETLRCGGDTRARTVRNALDALSRQRVGEDDWLLVHDAARPCLSAAQLSALLRELEGDAIGGLLAAPVVDTLKRADQAGRIQSTEPRAGLWQAQTPQMFRFEKLRDALTAADLANVTDEAQAMEALGLRPKLVRSDASNLKVTHAEDLALAEAILAARGK